MFDYLDALTLDSMDFSYKMIVFVSEYVRRTLFPVYVSK